VNRQAARPLYSAGVGTTIEGRSSYVLRCVDRVQRTTESPINPSTESTIDIQAPE